MSPIERSFNYETRHIACDPREYHEDHNAKLSQLIK